MALQFPGIVQPNSQQLNVPYLAKMQEYGQEKKKQALVDRALNAYRSGQDADERNSLQRQADSANGIEGVTMDRNTAAAVLQRHAPELYTTIQQEETSALKDAYYILGDAEKIADPEERLRALQNERSGLQRKYPNANIPDLPDDVSLENLKTIRQTLRPYSGELGANAKGGPAEIQEFEYLTNIIQNPDKYSPEVVKAAEVKLRIRAGAVGSAAQTIADEGTTDVVAGSEAEIEGAKSGAREKGKLEVQAEMLPKIRADIKQAEKEATARGETVTDLTRAKAALPGLEETVGKLKQLAPIATNTLTGRVFNAVVRELGFGATEGATARAQFIAIVANQVLPLLRDTFGAQFTEREGETLKATMGDPNLTPEEKIAQLDAFIQQKYRDVETKERELGVSKGSNIDDLVAKYAQ